MLTEWLSDLIGRLFSHAHACRSSIVRRDQLTLNVLLASVSWQHRKSHNKCQTSRELRRHLRHHHGTSGNLSFLSVCSYWNTTI